MLHSARRLGISHVLFDKRQIAAGTLANLAIRSEEMRTCCLTLIWQDDRIRALSPRNGRIIRMGFRN